MQAKASAKVLRQQRPWGAGALVRKPLWLGSLLWVGEVQKGEVTGLSRREGSGERYVRPNWKASVLTHKGPDLEWVESKLGAWLCTRHPR